MRTGNSSLLENIGGVTAQAPAGLVEQIPAWPAMRQIFKVGLSSTARRRQHSKPTFRPVRDTSEFPDLALICSTTIPDLIPARRISLQNTPEQFPRKSLYCSLSSSSAQTTCLLEWGQASSFGCTGRRKPPGPNRPPILWGFRGWQRSARVRPHKALSSPGHEGSVRPSGQLAPQISMGFSGGCEKLLISGVCSPVCSLSLSLSLSSSLAAGASPTHSTDAQKGQGTHLQDKLQLLL